MDQPLDSPSAGLAARSAGAAWRHHRNTGIAPGLARAELRQQARPRL
jgi:hypothetical protein